MLRVSSFFGVALSIWSCNGSGPPAFTSTSPLAHDRLFPLTVGPHAGMDCNDCHGEFDTFSEFSCVGCHDHAQDATDSAHRAVPDYVFGPQTCLTCHPDGQAGELSPESHAVYYPIGPGTTHEATCLNCHLDPADRRIVSCIDCHSHAQTITDAQHRLIPNYLWETRACLDCHKSGEVLSRDAHATWFPIAALTAHQDTACGECHTDPGDRHNVNCVDCHAHPEATTLTQHRRVGNYSFASASCLRCHYDSAVVRIANHLPFRVGAGSEHSGPEVGCIDCHPQTQPEKPWAADWVPFDCLGCHTQSQTDRHHREESGYRYESQTCVMRGCHPDGSE